MLVKMRQWKSVAVVDNLKRNGLEICLNLINVPTSCVALPERPHAQTIGGGQWQTIGVR